MIGACCKKCIAQGKIGTLVKDQQVWTVKIAAGAMLARTGVVAFAIIKSKAIAINGSTAFNRNIFSIGSIDKYNIAITLRHAFAC